jgi:hypothetical protein
VTILNRTLKWDGKRLRYRADQKHAETIISEMDVKMGDRTLSMPCVKDGVDNPRVLGKEEKREASVELTGAEASKFRRVAATANFLACDRMDINYSVKEICREMSAPTVGGLVKLRRLARYLVDTPELEVMFASEGVDESVIDVYTDSDWAGCIKTRKSTSGGVMHFGGGLVKSWSSTQASVALSVGEAEFYAGIKGAAEGIGYANILRDLGIECRVNVWMDSTTAKSMCSRTGAGKARHIDTRFYWIQDVVKKGVVVLHKVDTKFNPADLLTKPQGVVEIMNKCGLVGVKLLRQKARWSDAVSDDEGADMFDFTKGY